MRKGNVLREIFVKLSCSLSYESVEREKSVVEYRLLREKRSCLSGSLIMASKRAHSALSPVGRLKREKQVSLSIDY